MRAGKFEAWLPAASCGRLSRLRRAGSAGTPSPPSPHLLLLIPLCPPAAARGRHNPSRPSPPSLPPSPPHTNLSPSPPPHLLLLIPCVLLLLLGAGSFMGRLPPAPCEQARGYRPLRAGFLPVALAKYSGSRYSRLTLGTDRVPTPAAAAALRTDA